MTDGNIAYEPTGVSPESLATLGEGHIAYVKQIRSEDVPGLFPQAPKIAPGLKLFALHAADGTPIMLTDSREAAIARKLCTTKGMQIGSDGVQLLGGHGFVKEHPVERWYRDLRAIGIMEGGVLV